MTEESYILPLNLIEYEEFTQTEQSSHHNDDDCDDLAQLEDPAAGSLHQLEEKYSADGSYDQFERILQHPSSTAQVAKRDLTINVEDNQIDGHHHQQSNNTGQQLSRREGESDHNLFEQQLNTPRQTQLREGSISSSSKNNICEGSASSRQDLKPLTNREEIFSSKIEHLQRIIGTQREHIQMKEEKILFLLGQIATLNSNLAAKSAETSSIKRNFANIQQEMEQLKQQQKIKDQILNGESQILERKIEQEEQIIYTLDQQLHHQNRSSRACSPTAAAEGDENQRRPAAYSEHEHHHYLQQQQLQQQYHSHHHLHETAGMIVDSCGSRSSKHNRKQIADMLNSSKAPAIVAPSKSYNSRNNHTAEIAIQNDIRQYPPTTHNAPSLKSDSHEMKVYPASFSSGSCSGVCGNSSLNKRSSSSHQHATSPPPLMSQTYITKIPRSDVLEEESSTSTFSPASMKAPITLTASKHSAAVVFGSGGVYRDQYVKNIEELQTRLEILKKKRAEYDGKEKTWNKSVHSAAAGGTSSTGTATAGCISGTSSSFHQYGTSTRATNLGSSSFSPKCNESSLLHFASIKKIDSSNPHRESYFNKHLFSTATVTASPTAHIFTLGSEQPSSGTTTINNNHSVKKQANSSKSPSTIPQYLGPFGIISKKQSQSQQQFFPAESNSHHHPLHRGDPFLFFDSKKKDSSSSSNNYSRVTRKSPVAALPAYKTTSGSMSSSMISQNHLREVSPTEIHSPQQLHLSSKQSSLFTSIRQKPKLHEEQQQHNSFTSHQLIKASSLERHSPSRLQQIQQQILLHSNRHNDKSASKTKGPTSLYQQEQRIADHNSLSASLKKITDHKMSWESLIQRDSTHPLSFTHHSYISRNPNNSVTFQDTIPQDINTIRPPPRRTSTFSISPRSPPLILARNNDLQHSKMLPFS